jgi:hypothetical protein
MLMKSAALSVFLLGIGVGQLVLFRSYYEDGSCVLGPKTLTLSDKSLSIVG